MAAERPKIVKKLRAFYEKWWAGVEPGINKFVPLIIGAKEENPTILSSGFWEGGDANTQWTVAQGAGGGPKGGVWHVEVLKEGKYKLELSRWPFHLGRGMRVTGPDKTVGGGKLREGKAFPIMFGCVSLNNNAPVIVEAEPGAKSVIIEMGLKQGENIIQAFFKNKDRVDLCGAYYVRVSQIL